MIFIAIFDHTLSFLQIDLKIGKIQPELVIQLQQLAQLNLGFLYFALLIFIRFNFFLVHTFVKNPFAVVDCFESRTLSPLGPAYQPQETIKDSHLLVVVLEDVIAPGSDAEEKVVVVGHHIAVVLKHISLASLQLN